MARTIQYEHREVTRTLLDWIQYVLSDVDPAPTVADIESIGISDQSFVMTTLNAETPVGNITSKYAYEIEKQSVIDSLLSQDIVDLTPDEIEDVSYDLGLATVTFFIKPIHTEL